MNVWLPPSATLTAPAGATAPAPVTLAEIVCGAACFEKFRVAGVESALLARSTACTSIACAPGARFVSTIVVDAPYALHVPALSRQRYCSCAELARLSVPLTVSVVSAEWIVEPSAGPVRICVSGVVRSPVKLRLAGVGSAFPASSVAYTDTICGPSSRLVIVALVSVESALHVPLSSR